MSARTVDAAEMAFWFDGSSVEKLAIHELETVCANCIRCDIDRIGGGVRLKCRVDEPRMPLRPQLKGLSRSGVVECVRDVNVIFGRAACGV